MDVLSEVLPTVQLRSTLLCQVCVRGEWGVRFAETSAAKSKDEAWFHVITGGRCEIVVDGSDAAAHTLEPGDFVVLPHGHAHVLRTDADAPIETLEARQDSVRVGDDGVLHYGCADDETAEETTLVCGTLRFADAATSPLLRALPPLLLVRGEDKEKIDWLQATLGFIACEARSQRPGSQTVISRLMDILFVQAIRGHLTDARPDGGWLHALVDPQIGPALRAVHQHPEADWTVARLAGAAALSRSAFADRFGRLVGETPLQYVTRWRMHRAAALLRLERESTVGGIADRVGYESEAAFNRTFRRWMGMTPGSYRKKFLPAP